MVSIRPTVQNLVTIDAAVSITWKFQYLAQIAWKRLFEPPKLEFWRDFDITVNWVCVWQIKLIDRLNGVQYQRNPKRHILFVSPRRLNHQARKSADRSLSPVCEFPKRGIRIVKFHPFAYIPSPLFVDRYAPNLVLWYAVADIITVQNLLAVR